MIWCGINNSASLRYIALSKRARTHTHTYMYAPHTHTHTYAHARTCTRTCAHRLALLHTIADDSVSGLSRFPATVDMDDLVKWLMSVRYRQLRSAMLALLPGTDQNLQSNPQLRGCGGGLIIFEGNTITFLISRTALRFFLPFWPYTGETFLVPH